MLVLKIKNIIYNLDKYCHIMEILIMSKLSVLSIFAVLLLLTGCAENQYGNYPSSSYPYPNNYPYPQNQYPNGYPANGYPAGAYQPPYYPPNQNTYNPRNNYPRNNNHGLNNNRPPANNAVVVPVPAQQNISPSCPSGTRYNGRTCVITDNRLRKPGGDGNINPCPKGMWNSNGKCIKG